MKKIYIFCNKCDTSFALEECYNACLPSEKMDLVIEDKANSSADQLAWHPKAVICPHCKKENVPNILEIGCPHCHNGIRLSNLVLGNQIECPECHQVIDLPDLGKWKDIEKSRSKMCWEIISLPSRETFTLNGIEEISNAIRSGKIKPHDLCITHKFALPKDLIECTNIVNEFRKLYDPLGAYCSEASTSFASIFALCCFFGAMLFGIPEYGVKFLFLFPLAILGTFLSSVGIGIFINIFVAGILEISIGKLYLECIIFIVGFFIIFWIGNRLSYNVNKLIGNVMNLNKKRVVNWR